MSDKPYFVHESSYVDEPCAIGDGTKIWHFTHVMKDAVIGRNCNIGQNVLVSSGVKIGEMNTPGPLTSVRDRPLARSSTEIPAGRYDA